MSSPRLKERLEFVKQTPTDELVKNHLKEVFALYQVVYGEVCTGCLTKIAGYIKKLKNLKNYKTMSKEKPNFRLKKGTIIPVPGTSEVYSDQNMTDEIALKFIKKNPNRKQLFEVLPKNLDELLAEAEGNEEKALGDYTISELKKKYPDATGRTKADLIKNIEEIIASDQAEGVNPNPEMPEEEE